MTPVSNEPLEHLEMARDLIREAKGADGPNGGYVTDHLDAAENWLDKVEAALRSQTPEPPSSEVRVKPWVWKLIGENHWHADTPFGPWEVCDQPMFGKSWRTFSPAGWKTYHGDDPDELKRLSEQEVSKRVLATLSPTASQPVTGEEAERSEPPFP